MKLHLDLWNRLLGKPTESIRRDWLTHARDYPRFHSKPSLPDLNYPSLHGSIWRKLGGRSRFLRSQSGLCLPTPDKHASDSFKIWKKPGLEHTTQLPSSLTGQAVHDTFRDYHPSFKSDESFIMDIPNGSFHGHDHSLFDEDLLPIDWNPPYWALDCTLPGTLFRGRLPAPRKLKGKALVLSAPGAQDNYWHLIFDSLPKIKLLEDAGISLSSFAHIIVDQKDHPLWKTVFDQLNVDLNTVLEAKENPFLTADRLCYVSLGCLIPPDPWVLEWLRTTFLPEAAQTTPHRKIYISRARAQHRRFEQEAVFRERLESEGFETIALETLTPKQQIETMHCARAVVAPHGAGLSNLVWCQPGTRVVELFAYEYVSVCYWNLCTMLDLPYTFAIGERTHQSEPKPIRAVMDQDRLIAPVHFPDPESLAQATLSFINT